MLHQPVGGDVGAVLVLLQRGDNELDGEVREHGQDGLRLLMACALRLAHHWSVRLLVAGQDEPLRHRVLEVVPEGLLPEVELHRRACRTQPHRWEETATRARRQVVERRRRHLAVEREEQLAGAQVPTTADHIARREGLVAVLPQRHLVRRVVRVAVRAEREAVAAARREGELQALADQAQRHAKAAGHVAFLAGVDLTSVHHLHLEVVARQVVADGVVRVAHAARWRRHTHRAQRHLCVAACKRQVPARGTVQQAWQSRLLLVERAVRQQHTLQGRDDGTVDAATVHAGKAAVDGARGSEAALVHLAHGHIGAAVAAAPIAATVAGVVGARRGGEELTQALLALLQLAQRRELQALPACRHCRRAQQLRQHARVRERSGGGGGVLQQHAQTLGGARL